MILIIQIFTYPLNISQPYGELPQIVLKFPLWLTVGLIHGGIILSWGDRLSESFPFESNIPNCARIFEFFHNSSVISYYLLP